MRKRFSPRSRDARIAVRSTDADVEALLTFYEAGRRSPRAASTPASSGRSNGFWSIPSSCSGSSAIRPAPAGSAYRFSDLELASRLSFFLWSSIPDDELLDLASRGKLRDPAVLEQQVRRMLADSRARRALVDNFAGQWLELRNLREHTPDPDIFASSTRICATRCSAKRSCFSRASCARIAASWTC